MSTDVVSIRMDKSELEELATRLQMKPPNVIRALVHESLVILRKREVAKGKRSHVQRGTNQPAR